MCLLICHNSKVMRHPKRWFICKYLRPSTNYFLIYVLITGISLKMSTYLELVKPLNFFALTDFTASTQLSSV